MRSAILGVLAALLVTSPTAGLLAQEEDAPPGYPFEEGDVIGIEDATKLKGYIPKPFWDHREYFFFEGMQMRIGPFKKDFSASDPRRQVDQAYGGTARIGRTQQEEGWLEFYLAGKPFAELDPNDPDVALKIAWNATHRHDPMEGAGHFKLSFWERDGVPGPFFLQGNFWGMRLANRTDKAETGGLYFEDDNRRSGGKITLEYPSEWRTLAAIGYRYLTGDNSPLRDPARDAWAYIPQLRRIRRIPASTEEQETIPGTDFMVEDINGFNFSTGVIQKYEFKFLGEAEVLTPIDTTLVGFPLDEKPNLGPHGYSFANDVWQVREAYIRQIRKKKKTPTYSKKLLWVDKQTYSSLYAAAYDKRGELWRLIYIVHRWSESPAHQEIIEACRERLHRKRENGMDHPQVSGGERFLYPIGHIIVNVRNGTGNRIEAWDAHATHLRDVDKRRNLDSNRLLGR
jgi:hypothetical protein